MTGVVIVPMPVHVSGDSNVPTWAVILLATIIAVGVIVLCVLVVQDVVTDRRNKRSR